MTELEMEVFISSLLHLSIGAGCCSESYEFLC